MVASNNTREEKVMNKGAWSSHEDQLLKDYVKAHGEGKWGKIFKQTGLKRCGKSCRLRWLNYLKPDIRRGNITHEEEDLIIRLHKLLGNRWSLIAGRIPGRTDNEIKNYFNTTLKRKRLKQVNDNKKASPKSTENKPTKETEDKTTPIKDQVQTFDGETKKLVEPSTLSDSKAEESDLWANLALPIDNENDHALWSLITDLDLHHDELKVSDHEDDLSKLCESNSIVNVNVDWFSSSSSAENPFFSEEFLKSTWAAYHPNFPLDWVP